MRAVVTGGAGFIGHHLVAGLVARGDEVSVLDDFSTGRRSRLEPVADVVTLVEGNILDARSLDQVFAGCEVVFHEAAMVSVAESFVAPRELMEVNAAGSIEVMLAAQRAGVRRVVFASSSAVYGASGEVPCRETAPAQPISPYGASKLAAEHLIHALGKRYGVETVALRYFNVYGPGQDAVSEYAAVIPRFIDAVLAGRQPVINGNPEISRDFVHAGDVVVANLLAGGSSTPSGLTCNIGSGSRTTLLELVRTICAELGVDVEPIVGPSRAGDIEHSYADLSVAREALGYQPGVKLRDGIAGVLTAGRVAYLNGIARGVQGSS